MAELGPRKQTILRAVIVEYVSAAEPVGSELLTAKYELGVKSATIRNELADLSDLGYLEQPHTSAGRIPSDLGYRYYVDHLVFSPDTEKLGKQAVQDAAEEGEILQALLRDTMRALSRVTQHFTAATLVRDSKVTVRNAVVSALGPTQAILVLVLSNGHVENRMIECPPGLTLQDLGRVNEAISQVLVNQTVRSLVRSKAPSDPTPQVDKLLSNLWAALRSISRELTRGSIATQGEEFLIGQPEFQKDATALSGLLEAIKHSELLYDAVGTPGDQQTTVTIGKEHRRDEMHKLSVIRQSFYVGDTEAGTIAIIGPTRMRYEASIPMVGYAARALSESLTKFLG